MCAVFFSLHFNRSLLFILSVHRVVSDTWLFVVFESLSRFIRLLLFFVFCSFHEHIVFSIYMHSLSHFETYLLHKQHNCVRFAVIAVCRSVCVFFFLFFFHLNLSDNLSNWAPLGLFGLFKSPFKYHDIFNNNQPRRTKKAAFTFHVCRRRSIDFNFRLSPIGTA